ncbi:MAG: hypothetical protein L6R38_000519 [Xanthoria sp. 2 TBL-2021]|nr:MAG: hypothetical protein L6R38_000519 [Xanthoria sp. 2 TBL-2021]
MPDLSILGSLAPYHILTYGTLLGSSIFQSFIGGVVAFKSLPRAQFATLQTAIFPIYFSLQSACPVLLALTYPGSSSTKNPLLGGSTSPSGYKGFLAQENRWSVAGPIAAILAANVLNLVWAGPRTNEIMRLRKHQETRDGKKAYDAPPHSKAMQKFNKDFSRMHGVSASLNLAALAMTVFYGVVLAERIQ